MPQLCDRLVIIDRGNVVAEGRPRDLISTTIGRGVIEVQDPPRELVADLGERGVAYEHTGSRLFIPSASGGTEGEIYGTNSVTGDPMFVNAAAADFHVGPGSPAVVAGTAADAPPVDFDGTPRPLCRLRVPDRARSKPRFPARPVRPARDKVDLYAPGVPVPVPLAPTEHRSSLSDPTGPHSALIPG